MHTDPTHEYPAFLLVGCNFNIHYCWCDVTNIHACRFCVSATGIHVCCFSTTICMPAGKNVSCDGLVAIHGCCSMKLRQICLRTWYHSIRHVSIENQREKLLDRCPSIRHANLNCETSGGQDCCYVVIARYMPAGPVGLHCYVAAAATNMYSGLV